ncbi:MAG: PQQ-binding-like beta-propeller repeat protein [Candidatus Dormibacteraeota bacterium]|nr:PQQ-binding-like beta-propeller repeat protein [Candidatus Dormibacteraeota bacterium]
MRRLATFWVCAAGLLLGVTAPAAWADWTTYHADGALSGVDQSSGSAVPFAPAWSVPGLAGNVWGEPLVFSGLVIVATESNDLYAFNAATGAPAWHVNLGAPVPSTALPCGNISPTVGITSTPVIDPYTATLYAVADLRSGSSATHTLFALNARTGAVTFSRSVEPPGDTPLNQLQRESLAFDHGRVLVGFGGNDGDCGQYKGYLVSAPSDNNGVNSIFTVPTTREGAIWSGGGAPAVDAAGNVFVPTGNAANGPGNPFDHGDTLEKLTPTATELDYWAPSTWAQDSASDADLGSVSPALLPGNLVYQGGKNGNGYLVSTTGMGHIGGELFSAAVCNSFGSDAYANGILYVACTNGVHALNIDAANHRFASRWTGPADANGPPIIAGGLVWVTATGSSKLYGLDPLTGAVKVTQTTPGMEHFVTPAATDGRLFLATGSTLNAYTIATAVAPPTPAPPSPTPPALKPAPKPAATCRTAVRLTLHVPRHERIVKVTVYRGHHRLLVRRGRRLRRVSVAHLGTGRVTLALRETPRPGRRFMLVVHVRNCHQLKAPRHRRHRA